MKKEATGTLQWQILNGARVIPTHPSMWITKDTYQLHLDYTK